MGTAICFLTFWIDHQEHLDVARQNPLGRRAFTLRNLRRPFLPLEIKHRWASVEQAGLHLQPASLDRNTQKEKRRETKKKSGGFTAALENVYRRIQRPAAAEAGASLL